ncbi:PAS domain S-box protein [Thermanaerosceptrum fracticalcis]|jgi:PAS domain S-box-containing protein|uniref:HTH-type transcriptional regulatory protein TyrR n=1 Tax=Thermanaerosceptrum fracticalcis TaxID=1712410 RepID=A0A7G6E3U1_THEFR|nr:sigma 54-interacting transcriptional regulator [Thermanaerosceptrum fracticalcis]QNB46745.1 PAS domain S-box protein [Thermanaerosceptrum fracticalcis]
MGEDTFFLQYGVEQLKTILEAAHNGIVVIDASGKIVIFNTKAEEIIGLKAAEAIGRPVDEVMPQTGLLHVLRTGEPQLARKTLIGSTYVLSNRTPVIRDGKVVGAIGVFQDISEVEALFKELTAVKECNREMDTIIESLADGIYITDGAGVTLRVNSAYEKITGVRREEVIGRHMDELVKLGYFSESVTILVLQKKQRMTIMQELKTGKTVMVTGIPVVGENGEILRVVTCVRDMTELNRLQKELDEAKTLNDRYYSELEELRLRRLTSMNLVSKSKEMRNIVELAIRLGEVDTTVLVLGESGVGKEVIAHLIHKSSKKKDGPFVTINCGAIPENLMESELFGYESGAFTGAKKEGKPGLFESANGGTVFLDEIGDLPSNLQVKLLRVLQGGEIVRVGGTKSIPIDVRVIAATNKSLEDMVKQGTFREDLYYRLNVVPILIPPLRKRKEDIPALAIHFLKKFNEKYKVNKWFAPEVIEYFTAFAWPGNVRELENMVERLFIVSGNSNVISPDYLPGYVREQVRGENGITVTISEIVPLKEAIEDLERQLIFAAMARYKTTRKAALALGIDQSNVVRKLQKYVDAETHQKDVTSHQN